MSRATRPTCLALAWRACATSAFLAIPLAPVAAQAPIPAGPAATANAGALGSYPVIEFRRYTIKPGQRVNFAKYFEAYFPEAFEQLGAVAAGSFFTRNDSTLFTWIRGFHDIESRAIANAAFYYGPVWREHRVTLNDLIIDSDNVLLLRALTPSRSVTILPAVDPVTELRGAGGVVVAQIFAVKPGAVDSFARRAEAVFAGYREAGAREAGVMVTLDVANNFPQLPVRADGPYLVWLGIVPDDAALHGKLLPLVTASLPTLMASGWLRAQPELLLLNPTPRSRLRWLQEPTH